MWRESPFRTLPDDAKLLFVYLQTGPHTTIVPGLSAIGKSALAEQLRWRLPKFQKAFAELEQHRMVEADWNAGVVFVPDVLRVDAPDNGSVIKSWKSSWSEIPECPLKAKVSALYWAHCEDRGTTFLDGFIEATEVTNPFSDHRHGDDHGVPHGGGDGVPHGVPHQEQEQEQEQEQYVAPSALDIEPVSDDDFDDCVIGGDQGKPEATYAQTVKVIRELYAESAFDGERNGYDSPTGQDDLKEDTKKQLALLGLTYDGDTLRKALDAQEVIENRGLRRR